MEIEGMEEWETIFNRRELFNKYHFVRVFKFYVFEKLYPLSACSSGTYCLNLVIEIKYEV